MSTEGNMAQQQTDLPAASPVTDRNRTDPERWVEEYGDYLFKYALSRLHDAVRAEDMVQETFLAGLKGASSYHGQAAERSWLVGILKNKICDYYRKAGRETSFTDLEFYSGEEDKSFIEHGPVKNAWVQESAPQEWSSPGNSIDKEEFWKTYRNCSDRLPQTIGTVFNLREVDGLETKAICEMLQITENNLWVMLHRARMALRRCLETNWFGKQKGVQ